MQAWSGLWEYLFEVLSTTPLHGFECLIWGQAIAKYFEKTLQKVVSRPSDMSVMCRSKVTSWHAYEKSHHDIHMTLLSRAV